MPSPVTSIVLWNGEEQFDKESEWEKVDGAMLLNFVEKIDPEALVEWQKSNPAIAFVATHTAGISYFANHCAGCNAAQGDWYLTQPDGPFFPLTEEGVQRLSVTWVNQPIEATCGYSQASWLDDFVEKAIP